MIYNDNVSLRELWDTIIVVVSEKNYFVKYYFYKSRYNQAGKVLCFKQWQKAVFLTLTKGYFLNYDKCCFLNYNIRLPFNKINESKLN